MTTLRLVCFITLIVLALTACAPHQNWLQTLPVWEPASTEIEQQNIREKHPDISQSIIDTISHDEFKPGLTVARAEELFGPNVEKMSRYIRSKDGIFDSVRYYGSRFNAIFCYVKNKQIVGWKYMPEGVSLGLPCLVSKLNFTLSQPGFAEIVVVDSNGAPVDTLCYEQLEIGSYTVSWDLSDWQGQNCPAGKYSTSAKIGDQESLGMFTQIN